MFPPKKANGPKQVGKPQKKAVVAKNSTKKGNLPSASPANKKGRY